jgi:hypothetical protein
MDSAIFDQAVSFMFSDVQREIQLARVPEHNVEQLRKLGITPGGGNFLAALGLLCYTEYGGRVRSGTSKAADNFNSFFDSIGKAYAAFRASFPKENDVYDTFRCGLAHEYWTKQSCTIAMFAPPGDPGIGRGPSGQLYFAVENYATDLRAAFARLRTDLFGVGTGSPAGR